MGGIEDLINKYEKIRDEADATILHCLQASGNETVLNIQSRTPVRTGRLKSEMKCWQPQQEGNYYYIDVNIIRYIIVVCIVCCVIEYIVL